MIGKKYFKIWIMHIVDFHVYYVVLGASIRSILNSVEFHICEIPYNLYLFYLPILFHYFLDEVLVHFLKPAYEQFTNQNAFIYFLCRICLVFQLISFRYGKAS